MSLIENHRKRWMRRISNAETAFRIIENDLHEVLNYIEDNELDVTIHAKLMDIVNKTQPYNK